MKIAKVTCLTTKPEVIAKGVSGGGYVHINVRSTGAPIGTKEFSQNPTDSSKSFSFDDVALFFRDKSFWLNEGEEVYGAATYDGFNHKDVPSTYYVIHLDTPPSSQNQQAPINLTGTIQLNQQ